MSLISPIFARSSALSETTSCGSATRFSYITCLTPSDAYNLSSIDIETKKEISKANFIIVSGADWIKGELLNKIKHKSLNVHMGIAQKYRGLDSNLWAWYHNDFKNMGVTLHKLDYSL